MSRPRTINHAIQNLKPGDWVIRITHGKFYNPVEVAKITPTQIHTHWGSRNGVDKYNRTDGYSIGLAPGSLISPATPAQIEFHKAEQQKERDKATAHRQAHEAEQVAYAALSATLPEGIHLQRGNGGTFDVVISDRTTEQVRQIAHILAEVL